MNDLRTEDNEAFIIPPAEGTFIETTESYNEIIKTSEDVGTKATDLNDITSKSTGEFTQRRKRGFSSEFTGLKEKLGVPSIPQIRPKEDAWDNNVYFRC